MSLLDSVFAAGWYLSRHRLYPSTLQLYAAYIQT